MDKPKYFCNSNSQKFRHLILPWALTVIDGIQFLVSEVIQQSSPNTKVIYIIIHRLSVCLSVCVCVCPVHQKKFRIFRIFVFSQIFLFFQLFLFFQFFTRRASRPPKAAILRVCFKTYQKSSAIFWFCSTKWDRGPFYFWSIPTLIFVGHIFCWDSMASNLRCSFELSMDFSQCYQACIWFYAT